MRLPRLIALALALLCFPVFASVSATPTSVSYAGNGSSTVFPVTFPFFASTDLTVTQTVSGVTSSATGFVVSGGSDATGNVTFTTAPASGTTITISRTTPRTQPTSFLSQGSFLPRTHEQAFDRLTLQTQELTALEASDVAALQATVASLTAVAEGSTFSGNKTITGNLTVNGSSGITAANGPLLGTYFRTGDGTAGTPAHSFLTEPTSGLYRIGLHDFGLSLNGALFEEWTTTAVNRTYTGSGAQVLDKYLAPALTAGNYVQWEFGQANSANASGLLSYVKNATANQSTFCIDVNGNGSTICARGDDKAIIGAGSTGIQNTYGATYTFAMGSVLHGQCAGSAQTLTGVSVGGVCNVSTDGELAPTGHLAVTPWCAVTAPNTIIIFLCNGHPSTDLTSGSGAYHVRVWQP